MISTALGAPARVALFTILLGGLCAGDASRADPLQQRLEQLEATVERQQAQIEVLADEAAEAGSSGSEASAASEHSGYNPSRSWRTTYGSSEAAVQVHGFINLEFVKAQSEGAHGGWPNFDLHHANTFVDARLRSDFRTHIEMEFEHAIEEVEIDQAYLAWTPFSWLGLKAGRFYAPFGIERYTWYPSIDHLVSRPLPFPEILPGNMYQHGLLVSGEVGPGDPRRFGYEFSLSNGLGQDAVPSRRKSREFENNNDHIAFTGRVATSFWPWLEIGASFHSQRFDSSGPKQDLLFLGLDAAGRWRGFELRAEYVYASLDRVADTGLYQTGWYTQLSYTLDVNRRYLDSIVFVTRVDQIDPDRSVDRAVLRYAFGSAWQIHAHFRVKAEYRVETEDGPSKRNNAFMAAFVADF